jgi:hypothetical protein
MKGASVYHTIVPGTMINRDQRADGAILSRLLVFKPFFLFLGESSSLTRAQKKNIDRASIRTSTRKKVPLIQPA